MAKKGQAIQLQTEVNNDEEWEKLLQREGLIVVDIYAEWCGPCSGMTGVLKKLKLEIGGDVLQLAVAKADKITALERFRNKCEPTWMLISNGKMVNFMFGANAPKLTRIITEELRKETEARQGRRERVGTEISELADEEQERQEAVEKLARIVKEKQQAKAAKELFERRTAECDNILESLEHFGIILVFPQAKAAYHDAFVDLLTEAGLTISQTEKFDISEELLEELFYFGEIPFTEDAIEELLNNQSLILLIKPIPAKDVTEPTDDLILEVLYGASKRPPGSPDSPARILAKLSQEYDEEIHEKPHELPAVHEKPHELPPIHEKPQELTAVWAPISDLLKATALRLFFHKQTEHCLIPEPEPTPPHYAVVFEAIRRYEVATIMEKYPDEVLRYGFFTSEIPEEAKLVAKSINKYERSPDRTPNEKMVMQVAKRKSECVLAFAQLKPIYISPNVKEGKNECKVFFPDDYDEPPEEEEEEPAQIPSAAPSISTQLDSVAASLVSVDVGGVLGELGEDDERRQIVGMEGSQPTLGEGQVAAEGDTAPEGVPHEAAETSSNVGGEVAPPAEGEAPIVEEVATDVAVTEGGTTEVTETTDEGSPA